MRSRISDLNKKLPQEGLMIESRIGENRMADYKLVRIGSNCDDEITKQDGPGSREVPDNLTQLPQGVRTARETSLR